jgi:hypothetical protein
MSSEEAEQTPNDVPEMSASHPVKAACLEEVSFSVQIQALRRALVFYCAHPQIYVSIS